MKRRALAVGTLTFTSSLALLFAPACGGNNSSSQSSSSSGQSSGNGSNGSAPNLGGGTGGSGGGAGGGSSGGGTPVACPSNLSCNVSCPNNGTTTITGTVMDPAGADPLYNVLAYVPSTTVKYGTLPKGVPQGADACSCSALLQGAPLSFASTDTSGKFTIANAPVGSNMQVVVQVGKWRKIVSGVTTNQCGNIDVGTIKLPAKGTDGDMPDIAVSTGGADSLECLLTRIGISPSEYVAGATGSGHVHIFNGGNGAGGGGGVGGPEAQQMSGAPASDNGLWDSVANLMKNDVVLLSCEGGETYDAQPANLAQYLDTGGRVFASHFHYAWFTGSSGPPNYSSPAEWGTGGSDLAAWSTGGGTSSATVGGEVVTTLTSGGGTYAKGVAMKTWLGNLNALSTNIGGTTVSSPELPIVVPRYNATVTKQAPSQEWIHLDPSTDPGGTNATTMYFSFDTPINAPSKANGGTPQYCGRAVFSGLHVGGASFDGVNCSSGTGGHGGGGSGDCNTGHVAPAPPPTGCDTSHPLSPQEKALEFMLFDLSACVIPENVPPTNDAGTVYIPK